MKYYLGLGIFYTMVVYHAMTMLVLSGCSTLDKLDMRSQCPYVETTYAYGVQPEFAMDDKHQGLARVGCVNHYGEGACLTKFLKTGDLQYQAICRRKP